MRQAREFFTIIFLIFFLSGLSYTQDILYKRFSPPNGFNRVAVEPNSFAAWLHRLPLQKPDSPILDFRGKEFKKSADSTVAAVANLDISGKRLEQCMDILIRFYSDYLIEKDQRDSIKFPLPDGLLLSWEKWRAGCRPHFKGLNFNLLKSAMKDSSAKNFERYLAEVFSYSGSQTFYHHYPSIDLADLRAGDFIVRKSRKGHAVLILDLVQNEQGEKMMMVGQGDTPACQFYILRGKNGSPWFPIKADSQYPTLPINKKMYWRGLRRFPAYTD